MNDIKFELYDLDKKTLVYSKNMKCVSGENEIEDNIKEVLLDSLSEENTISEYLRKFPNNEKLNVAKFIEAAHFMIIDNNHNYLNYYLSNEGKLCFGLSTLDSNWTLDNLNTMSRKGYIDLNTSIIRFNIVMGGMGSAGDLNQLVTWVMNILNSDGVQATLNAIDSSKFIIGLGTYAGIKVKKIQKNLSDNKKISDENENKYKKDLNEIFNRGIMPKQLKNFILHKDEWTFDELDELFVDDDEFIIYLMISLGYKINQNDVFVKDTSNNNVKMWDKL